MNIIYRISKERGEGVSVIGHRRRGKAMPQARYFIVQHDEDWMIKFHDEEFGPYLSKSEAMLFAVDAARKLGQNGENSEVCVMGENGHFRPEWTFGRDHYPPTL